MLPKILLIEDEPSIADNIIYALKTEGYETVWHPTASAALAAFEAGTFCLVVLDIGLPDRSGLEVCRELRRVSSVPIIFVTARKDEIDRVVGLEIGADDYVVKPFSPRELSARVKAVLRRSGQLATPPPVAEGVGAFAMDEERMEIRYERQPVPLSRYEYRLLKTFLERPGKVFSRDELMERAWDEPGSSMDRTVDAHIKTLRAKLHAINPSAEPIRTHRGVGYALVNH